MKFFERWILTSILSIVLMLCLFGCSEVDVTDWVSDEIEDAVFIADDITANPNIQLKKSSGSQMKYDDIYLKTLFSPDRVFLDIGQEDIPVEPEPTPARMQIDVPNLELVGTLQKTVDKSSYAFIKNANDADPSMRNKVRKYGQGEWIGDYLISLIESNRVTLMRGEEIALLQLKPSQVAGRPPARGGRQPVAGGGPTQQRAVPGNNQRRPASQQEREKEEEMKREKEMAGADRAESRFTGRGRQMQQNNAETSYSSGTRGSTAPYWAWSDSQASSNSMAPGQRGCGR